jgi:hypothetical protein
MRFTQFAEGQDRGVVAEAVDEAQGEVGSAREGPAEGGLAAGRVGAEHGDELGHDADDADQDGDGGDEGEERGHDLSPLISEGGPGFLKPPNRASTVAARLMPDCVPAPA